MAAPDLVAIAGDWHGDTEHAVRTVRDAAAAGAGVVLQVGDFGLQDWLNSDYLNTLQAVCALLGVEVWWLDGNHEDHAAVTAFGFTGDPFPVRPSVHYLPRGYRWTWHGHTWLAVGGAVSVDRALRTEGWDWWPQEELTERQATRIADDGRADVLLTHDCPAAVPVTFPPWPLGWDLADSARADAHRARLQRVVDAVQPRVILHGHLHMAFAKAVDMGWGTPEVVCLDRNRGQGQHWVLMDTARLQWRAP